ncbi:valine--tRNA ligase [Consotaella aegiceratis]|uniref:valine--tRNA ligase n=1 Tax=Consotaella aegiceratis TaxID=3097961 RepID=UPI002F3FF2ED
MMNNFSQNYNFREAESALLAYWRDSPIYKWDERLPAKLDYVIDTPPPTVSGTLHVGHVYSYTQADIIARFWRMLGRNVLYPIGWDDNGLPTERLVEKIKKVRGADMPRGEFVALCREVIPKYEEQFRQLFSRLGLSVDWSREYQTISDNSRAVSQLSFLDLYEKGLLERRLEPTLWDPADRTAIAQAEVEEMERTGLLNNIAFGIEGGGEVEIATTRPELLGGCAALMIHPDHPRAADLVGKRAISPLYGALVPIIADDTVDKEKGTGVVMCCTFGDVTDIQWWRTHNLPLRLVVDEAGKMLEVPAIGAEAWPVVDMARAREAIAAVAGLKIAKAREMMLKLLKDSGDLRSQTETNQVIPVAERSGFPLEIIVTPQWFIKTLDFKEELLAKGREINWHPAYMRQRFENWVQGLKWDWAISRQRHFGVPLPVWCSRRIGEEGKILLPTRGQLPVDPITDLPQGYTADEVTPERDVFDTWATSSVSPQLITRTVSAENGYDHQLHDRIFPMAMRPQAHEIIRTWAFYTIVKSLHHQNEVPWRDVCISGWCLASDGSKMSKSKGNIIDPNQLLEEFGADVVRYWTGTSRLGNDTALSPNTLKQGKRLVTKLWNACKLAHSSFGERRLQTETVAKDVALGTISHPLDLWLLGKLATTIETATASMESYEYANAFRAVEQFFWSDFCDNYLELVKYRVRDIADVPTAGQLSAQHTLLHACRAVLRLFAPLMPFVTETIASAFALPGDEAHGIHARGNWPRTEDYPKSDASHTLGEAVVDVVAAMRKIRSSLGVSRRAEVATMYVWPMADSASGLADMMGPVERDILEVSTAALLVFAEPEGEARNAQATSGTINVALAMREE